MSPFRKLFGRHIVSEIRVFNESQFERERLLIILIEPMKAEVPYLPIAEFEAKILNELLAKSGKDDEKFEEAINIPDSNSFSGDEDKYCKYVGLILEGMGMGKYIPLFKNEDIGLDVLLQLNADDLTALGITDPDDQKCILDNLEDYNAGDDPGLDLSYSDLNNIEDFIMMAKNVNLHLIRLNKHIANFLLKLSRSNLEDYFVSNDKTALKILKTVTNQAVIQTNRISKILFDGNFQSDNLIVTTAKANNFKLSSLMKNKLIKLSKRSKKLMKGRVLMVVLAVGIAVSLVILKKR